jgi:hypothetical protein
VKAAKRLREVCRALFGITPTYYQEEFMRRVLLREGKGKYVLVASTRTGKTTATSMLAVLLAILYPSEDVVVVAPTLRQSNILFSMVRNYFYNSPYLLGFVDRRRGFTREIIHLQNGSTLRMLTARSEEGLLGFGASTLIIDETASIPDEVIRTRLLRMLASPRNGLKPLLVLLGTPHRVGFLYDAWTSDDYVKFRWTWEDAVRAGIMKREMVEYFRRTLTDEEFRRWFMAEFLPEREGLFFNPLAVRECVVRAKKTEKSETSAPLNPVLRGQYAVYAGVDIARYGEDETAVVFIRAPRDFSIDSGVVAVHDYYRWGQRGLDETFALILEKLNYHRPGVVVVDSTGLGAGVYDFLRHHYPGEVREAYRDVRREAVFEFMRRLIDEKRLLLPDDDYFIRQFNSYRAVYDARTGGYRIAKTEGMRDDLTDALAMALSTLLVNTRKAELLALPDPWSQR